MQKQKNPPPSRAKRISAAVLLLYLLFTALIRLLPTHFPQGDIWITFLTLGFASVSFFLGAFPLELTALILPIVLVVSGVLSAGEAFSSFSNSTILIFGGMFVVGGALFHTGLAERLSWSVLRLAGGRRSRVCLMVMLITGGMSSVLSNTGTAAVLLPIACAICDSANWQRKDLLYPMAVLCSTGGMISMVGTPPNIACNSFLQQAGFAPIGFFDFAAFGLPMTLFAIVYFLILERLGGQKDSRADLSALLTQEQRPMDRRQLLSGAILLGVIVVMVTDLVELEVAAISGALLCVLLNVLTPKEAYESLDLSVLFLFSGALALSTALDSSGAGALLSQSIIQLFHDRLTPRLLISILFLLTILLTHFMSNTACFALMAPIGLRIAEGLSVSPYPVMTAIALASSAAFATPIATPPNSMVLGPGNMTFRDFLFRGLPLCFAAWGFALFVIPAVWRF